MLFPTVDFGLFFLVVFAVSWALARFNGARKHFLLAASYVFYGCWDWRFCGLLALNALINFAAGLAIERAQSDERRRLIVVGAVAVNLLILAVFKYLGWFLQSAHDVLQAVGLERDIPIIDLVLPVGISFFTFQGISYVVDVYRRVIKAERSPLDVALYISFFPQLVAGPIVRASDFLPQLKHAPRLTERDIGVGLTFILIGLFKKMIVANYLATQFVDDVFFDPASHSAPTLLLAVYGYAVQIYCDFSGYSDIAIGVAALLGFQFKANFNQPYRATGLQDFWRRWHISLSTWLRDYLYIPLGGSRGGTIFTYRNLMITMLLGGIWHGAAWTFVIWGALHGGALVLERVFNLAKAAEAGVMTRSACVFATFHFVCFAWIFFRAEDLATALSFVGGLADFKELSPDVSWFALGLIFGSLAFQFVRADLNDRVGIWLGCVAPIVRGVVFIAGLLAIQWLAPSGVAPFIYFQF
ncbi:MAG: MBOAT family protein [Pseudomonadota bacterium]